MSEVESIAVHTKQSKAVKKLLVILVSAGGGAAFGYLMIGWLIRNRSHMLQLDSPGLLLLCLLPILFIVILTHELGHILGGWFSGHRFHMLVVGPLRITRDLSGLRAELNRSFAMAGGLALCLPSRLDHFSRDRFVMVLMGPLASALLAAVCWFAAHGLSQGSSLLVDVLTVTALCSTMISFITVLPHQSGGFPSDGAQMLGLVRGGADSEKLSIVMLIQTLSISGTRPREWQGELLERANTLKSKLVSYNATTELMAYSHYLDRQEYDVAQTYLEKSVSNYSSLPIGMRQGFALEAAYFWAFHRHDLVKATEWLDRGRGGFVERAARSRVEAAILILKGDSQQALEKIRQARSQLRASFDRGGALAEQDMLDALEARLDMQVALT